jgi:multidrug efflux system membrane fusion protein
MKSLSIFIVPVFFLMLSCNKTESENKTEEPIQVETVLIQEKNMSIPIRSSGQLYSKSELMLGFKTGGIIKQIYVDEGQSVKKGQLLAVLNLSEIQAHVYQTELALEKAVRDYKRAHNLYTDSVATLEQLQNAQTALEIAKSNKSIADFNMKYSRITAPSDGKILKKLAHENEITAAGYPIIMFGSENDDWIIKLGLTDRDIFNISENDKAEVTFDAYPGKIFNATVSEIGRSADPYTGTYEVELKLEREGTMLASGLISTVYIFPSKTKLLAEVPIEALIEGNGSEVSMFVLNEENLIEKIKADVFQITDSKMILIPDKIKGKRIITSSVAYLNEGDRVETHQLYASESNIDDMKESHKSE